MDEILSDFLVETQDGLELASAQLVAYERDPSDLRSIEHVYRLMHTIKGTSGFLGLTRLGALAHATETLISALRDGLPVTSERISLMLRSVDRLTQTMQAISQNGSEPQGHDDDLIAAFAPKPLAEVSELTPSAEIFAAPASGALSIRVSVGALERLMMLVQELVQTRNQLQELTRDAKIDERLSAPLQRFASLTSDLQEAVVRARMQPVSRLFANLPRLVRDLSAELGKSFHLVTTGEETELDRQMIERIRDPLIHIIRNAADHGLETASVRRGLGKPEVGTIRVAASHEAGFVTIDISDDGFGLDVERIRLRAIERGLVAAADAAALKDSDVFRFIFAPGFTTAHDVSSVSGRGMGMDVVRANIEQLGGTIHVTSRPGRGTHMALRIPLTLVIAPALIVETDAQYFAVPQMSIVEIISLDGQASHAVEMMQGGAVMRWRDDVLSVCDTRALFAFDERPFHSRFALVLQSGGARYVLIVDRVVDVQEIVVKPAGLALASVALYSGLTLLGDGSLVLVLDPSAIAASLGVVRDDRLNVMPHTGAEAAHVPPSHFLLFSSSEIGLNAVALALVAGIVKVPMHDIQYVQERLVLHHEGRFIPLVALNEAWEMAEDEFIPVIVLGQDEACVGLIVDHIVDIVEGVFDVQISNPQAGLIGTLDFGGRPAELIDPSHYLAAAHPELVTRQAGSHPRVLLVDDNVFFRDMLHPVLNGAGYQVAAHVSGEAALHALDADAAFAAFVIDLDMPQMDGFALAQALRARADCADVPMLALVSHSSAGVEARAYAAGFARVVGKFDRVKLLQGLGALVHGESDAQHSDQREIAA